MASMTMTASFLPTNITKLPSTSTASRRGLVVVNKGSNEKTNLELKANDNDKVKTTRARRDLVFAAAAAAACTLAKVAMADEEPQRGTPEAKKKYAPICVTMPTARICRK